MVCPENSGYITIFILVKRLSHQLRNDLRLYDIGEIESTYIEIKCSKSTNVIVGCIYKDPILLICDFKNNFISPLLLGLQKQLYQIIFLFNIDFLKYDENTYKFIAVCNSQFEKCFGSLQMSFCIFPKN